MSVELENALNETLAMAFEANNRARSEGRELARANAAARAAVKTQEIALLSQSLYPTSLIKDIAKGSQAVNSLIEAADIAQSDYECSREEVLLRKRELTILEEQMKRDWAEAGRIV